MLEYGYKDIKEITHKGILFINGCQIFFDECRCEWAKEKNVVIENTVCVAERYFLGKEPYFLFYMKDKVKIIFKKKNIFEGKRYEKKFHELQFMINRYGYSTYDMT